MCNKDAVLLCVRGSTTGRTNRADQSYALGRGVAAIETSDPTDQSFAYFALLSSMPSLLERTTGSVFPNLSRDDIASVALHWPDRDSRRAIAEVLGALDDKIEANRRAAAMAEGVARGLPLMVSTTTTVGVVARVIRRFISTNFLSGKDVEHFSLPAFDASRLPVVESGDEIKSGKFLLVEPTVLVSKLNPHIPRVWMATPSGTRPAVTSTEFVGLIPCDGLPVEVLWALCGSAGFSSQLVEMVKGTTGSHQRIAPEDILTVDVPDPRELEQEATESIVAAVCLAQALRRESALLAVMRDALLPQLLSGELRVKDVESLGGARV
ncbi:MAG: restriction endonuclease subunit S [Actinomycetes bacterium]